MGSSLFIKSKGFQEGYVSIATPEVSALRWISLGRLGVTASHPYSGHTGTAEEAVLTILSGQVTVEAEGKVYEAIGRSDPFSDGPTLVCLPPNSAYSVKSLQPTADILVAQAPTSSPVAGSLITPSDVPARKVGASNWSRHVWPGSSLAAGTSRLLIGETVNPPGNWSSYPPHKHDTHNPPIEEVYEEVYFFSFKPRPGFGMQRIYERREGADALNEVFAVEDGDTVIIPRGYHPVVAAPGYQMSYVWILCGEGKSYGAWSDDPAHAWLRAVEPMFES